MFRPGGRVWWSMVLSASLLLLLVGLMAGAAHTPGVQAMAFFRASFIDGVADTPADTPYSSIDSFPNDRVWWPNDAISYRAAASFRSAFPGSRFDRQVALAFATWDAAATTPGGAGDCYYDDPGAAPLAEFYDFRSLLLHEIGHALGMAHPDSAALDANRNFVLDTSGVPVVAPLVADITDNWVMSSFDTTKDMSTYNQTLAWDDLAAFRYAYPGRDLNFARAPNLPGADIQLRAADFQVVHDLDGDGTNDVTANHLAYTIILSTVPVDFIDNPLDPNDGPRLGRSIKAAGIWFNTRPPAMLRIGMRTRMVTWDITQVSPGAPPIRAVEIQTRFANNPKVLAHVDNPSLPVLDPQPFKVFTTVFDDPAIKNSLLHVWMDPARGSIAGNEMVNVGLTQDVFHWVTLRLRIWHDAFSLAETDFVDYTVVDVNESAPVFTAAARSDMDSRVNGASPARGASTTAAEPLSGIRLAHPVAATAPITLTALSIGDATRGGANDVSAITLTHLTAVGIAENFAMVRITPAALGVGQVLAPEEEFHVFVSGDRSQLPDTMTNYIFLSDVLGPEIVATFKDRPLVVAAQVASKGALITTYTVVGTPPIIGADAVDGPNLVFLPEVSRSHIFFPDLARSRQQ